MRFERQPRRENALQLRPALLAMLGLGLGMLNLGKAMHIDDTLYVSIARWIVQHPLDPYAGLINWQHITEPTYRVSISPPLLSYYFAGVIAWFGEAPVLLHAAMFPWILLACWSAGVLAQRFGGREPTALALFVLGSPGFVVGVNLMLDVPLLACMLASLAFLLRALEAKKVGNFLAAGLLAAFAVLIKYPGIVLIPLFVLAAWWWRRPAVLLATLPPLGAFLAWQSYSGDLYGAAQVSAGLGFLRNFRVDLLRQSLERSLTMCAIFGATLPLWFVSVTASRRRWTCLVGALAVAGLAAFLLPRSHDYARRSPWVNAAFVIAAGLGAISIVDAAGTVWPRRIATAGGAAAAEHNGPTPRCGDESQSTSSAASVASPTTNSQPAGTTLNQFLFLWFMGLAGFVIFFSPFVAVRSFLPAQLPLAALVLRGAAEGRASVLVVRFAVLTMLVLSGLLAWTDFRWAAVYPPLAQMLRERQSPQKAPVFFRGHWGWQYYAEKAGFIPWDARWNESPRGVYLLSPVRADKQYLSPLVAAQLHEVDRQSLLPNPLFLSTCHQQVGISFYGSNFGELPWGFSGDPTEEIQVLKALE